MTRGIIVQARMGSTRLPGKVLMEIKGRPVLWHVVNRLKYCKSIDRIIIATTTEKIDDAIEGFCRHNAIDFYRGSENDVLDRFYKTAERYKIDCIVRITSDCPLTDPVLIDEIITYYNQNHYDLVANLTLDDSGRTYPRGLDVEVFSFERLKDAFMNAQTQFEREHVTPYMYSATKNFYCYKNNTDYSKYRWTLDTPDDLALIAEIYQSLYNPGKIFLYSDILELINRKPELIKINQHIRQKA